MNNDLINGLVQLFGGVLTIINIVKLIKDKKIKGISWIPTAYFSIWGAWNMYYLLSLNQTYSFWGGLIIFSANAIWLGLLIYYYTQERKLRKYMVKHVL